MLEEDISPEKTQKGLVINMDSKLSINLGAKGLIDRWLKIIACEHFDSRNK